MPAPSLGPRRRNRVQLNLNVYGMNLSPSPSLFFPSCQTLPDSCITFLSNCYSCICPSVISRLALAAVTPSVSAASATLYVHALCGSIVFLACLLWFVDLKSGTLFGSVRWPDSIKVKDSVVFHAAGGCGFCTWCRSLVKVSVLVFTLLTCLWSDQVSRKNFKKVEDDSCAFALEVFAVSDSDWGLKMSRNVMI